MADPLAAQDLTNGSINNASASISLPHNQRNTTQRTAEDDVMTVKLTNDQVMVRGSD